MQSDGNGDNVIKIAIPSKQDINKVLYDDEIWKRVSDDTCPTKDNFQMKYDNFDFIGAYVNDKIAGIYAVNKIIQNYMHFMVLKEYRRRARDIFEACFAFYGKSVFCIIPICFPSVINFARKVGFSDVAVIGDFELRNSILYDGIKLERVCHGDS